MEQFEVWTRQLEEVPRPKSKAAKLLVMVRRGLVQARGFGSLGGLPGAGLSWRLNRSMSSSNQIYIFRLPSPTKFILLAGFWAYFLTVSTLHPHILATSLLMCIFISTMLCFLLHTPPDIPARRIGYFINRKARRMTSRVKAPIASKIKPGESKIIDFTSKNEYTLKGGALGPLPSPINLSGQSETRQTLLSLLSRTGLQAIVAGTLPNSSWRSPPFGFLDRVDIINIPQTVYNVNTYFKTIFYFLLSPNFNLQPITEAAV